MKQTKRTEWIPAYSIGATRQDEENDCVVRALSNVSAIDYDTVHELAAKHGRKAKKATYFTTSVKMFNELKYKVLPIGTSRASDWLRFETKTRGEQKNITLGRLIKDLPMGKYVVYIKGHALALIDGKIIDKYSNKSSSRVVAIFYDDNQFNNTKQHNASKER